MFPRRPRLVVPFFDRITAGCAVLLPFFSASKIFFFFFAPKVCDRSTSPRWEEAFHYLVRDPRDESLTVKVSASVHASLGTTVTFMTLWLINEVRCSD